MRGRRRNYDYSRNVIQEIKDAVDIYKLYHFDEIFEYAVHLDDPVFLKVFMNYRVQRGIRNYIYAKYKVWNLI